MINKENHTDKIFNECVVFAAFIALSWNFSHKKLFIWPCDDTETLLRAGFNFVIRVNIAGVWRHTRMTDNSNSFLMGNHRLYIKDRCHFQALRVKAVCPSKSLSL